MFVIFFEAILGFMGIEYSELYLESLSHEER